MDSIEREEYMKIRNELIGTDGHLHIFYELFYEACAYEDHEMADIYAKNIETLKARAADLRKQRDYILDHGGVKNEK